MDNDISKIVSLIMENPELIEKIKSLTKNEEKNEESERTDEAITASVPTYAPIESKVKRRQLLSALKPYLSEERSRAIDSMMNISDVIEIARRR